MAMLSVTITTPKHLSLSSHFLPHHHSLPLTPHPPPHKSQCTTRPISAAIIPSKPNPPQQQLYQPFRPPPSPIPPQFQSLDTAGRLEILTNRLGLWFDYAPLIPSLIQEGFTAPDIEEITGISGVEQNRLVVGAQVRDSLVQSKLDPQILSFFDLGGAELLYQIRLLSVAQRAAAAGLIVEEKFDARGAQELARAIKDFPRRKKEKGWESFDYSLPRDCLAFMYYRQALEHQDLEMRSSGLQKAMAMAGSERAKNKVLEELERKDGDGEAKENVMEGVRVPVVRMKVGEVSEATTVAVLPVCRPEEREKDVVDAPWECGTQGEFGVVVAEKEWSRWVVLPGWEPVVGLKRGGVVVGFADARALPWRVNRWYKEEAILVVADRKRKEVVVDDGFYLVCRGDDGLKVEKGSALKELGVEESLGTVVLVIRPPREDTEIQLSDEDWE